ncbi:MAG: hypothetical protein IJP80_01405 [Bacteroidales bacterium]|nr:hypothetical protein [Bacteroidales bacterium]
MQRYTKNFKSQHRQIWYAGTLARGKAALPRAMHLRSGGFAIRRTLLSGFAIRKFICKHDVCTPALFIPHAAGEDALEPETANSHFFGHQICIS